MLPPRIVNDAEARGLKALGSGHGGRGDGKREDDYCIDLTGEDEEDEEDEEEEAGGWGRGTGIVIDITSDDDDDGDDDDDDDYRPSPSVLRTAKRGSKAAQKRGGGGGSGGRPPSSCKGPEGAKSSGNRAGARVGGRARKPALPWSGSGGPPDAAAAVRAVPTGRSPVPSMPPPPPPLPSWPLPLPSPGGQGRLPPPAKTAKPTKHDGAAAGAAAGAAGFRPHKKFKNVEEKGTIFRGSGLPGCRHTALEAAVERCCILYECVVPPCPYHLYRPYHMMLHLV